jgi:hypothetical protein
MQVLVRCTVQGSIACCMQDTCMVITNMCCQLLGIAMYTALGLAFMGVDRQAANANQGEARALHASLAPPPAH